MAKNALIFHGTNGNPDENWFPWLKNELEKHGCIVNVPSFPTPDGQSLTAWLKVLAGYEINEDTILIGHSLGGLFLLRVLEQLKQPVKAAYFVAAPAGVRPIKFYDSDASFSPGFNFEWSKIMNSARHFEVFHSNNDEYVSLGNAQEIASKLNAKLNLVPNAGHFGRASNCTKLPILLNRILELPL
jgi:uncharacterized protein